MPKKTIINILFVLAVIFVLIGTFFQISENDGISIFYWIGLLFYAFGEIMKDRDKKQEIEKK
ncbi:MAG: hypothetical protein AAFQ37_09825 [Bacteroidota bacterium]